MYVTNKPIKLTVTLGRPTRDLTRKVSDGSQKVKTRHPRGVKTLHQNTSSMFSHFAGVSTGDRGFKRATVLAIVGTGQGMASLRLESVELVNVFVDNWRGIGM